VLSRRECVKAQNILRDQKSFSIAWINENGTLRQFTPDMSQLSAGEKFSNFFSYVRFFLFLAAVGGGGYYAYHHVDFKKLSLSEITKSLKGSENAAPQEAAPGEEPAPAPIAVNSQKPSKLLTPVMTGNLPLLWNDFTTEPVELKPDFLALEKTAAREGGASGKLQPAWQIAGQLCAQIRSVCDERNVAAVSLEKLQQAAPSTTAAQSKADLQAQKAKQAFFVQSAEQRWKAAVPSRQAKIETLYRQLLVAEARAEK
jgi:hypothetical protein